AKPQWVPILHLPFGLSLTLAERTLEKLGKSGLYRLVQMQRVIWAEKRNGRLRLRKSHAGSPDSLDSIRQMYDRCDGRYPDAQVRAARRQAKRGQARDVGKAAS